MPTNNNLRDRKAFFNETAEDWDRISPEKSISGFLETIIPQFKIKKGQRVLDIGTGTGVLVPKLADAVGPSGYVVAVDFAEKMVEQARGKYHNLPNVKFELQDAEDLNFPSGSFDVITCFGLFPHIENKQKALMSMGRVLKPEGTLAIAHALSSREIEEIHRQASAEIANDVMPAEEEMRNLFKAAGFQVDLIKDEPGCYLCIATKTESSMLKTV